MKMYNNNISRQQHGFVALSVLGIPLKGKDAKKSIAILELKDPGFNLCKYQNKEIDKLREVIPPFLNKIKHF